MNHTLGELNSVPLYWRRLSEEQCSRRLAFYLSRPALRLQCALPTGRHTFCNQHSVCGYNNQFVTHNTSGFRIIIRGVAFRWREVLSHPDLPLWTPSYIRRAFPEIRAK